MEVVKTVELVVDTELASEIIDVFSGSEGIQRLRTDVRDSQGSLHSLSGTQIILEVIGTIPAILGLYYFIKGKGKRIRAKIGSDEFDSQNFDVSTSFQLFEQWIKTLSEMRSPNVGNKGGRS